MQIRDNIILLCKVSKTTDWWCRFTFDFLASDGSPSLMPINLTAATQDITVVNSGEGPRMDSENGQHPASNQVYYSSS